MFQNWSSLTFLHWHYPPEAIRARVPEDLTVDTFEGEAWVGVTPFLLTGLRPPFVPSVTWISRFPEMNVRTYVIGPDNEPGIWFFTLEAARLAAVIGARVSYGLPYHWAHMRVNRDGDVMTYTSQRHIGSGYLRARVQTGALIEPDERTVFLTARFRLYSHIAGHLITAQVEHPPWPLSSASLLALDQTILETVGLPRPSGEPLIHFSPGVSASVGRPKFLIVPRPPQESR